MKGEKIFSGKELFLMEISNQDKLKLIHFLNFICDYEASKPLEEMDEELIDACVKVSLELQNKRVNHSPEFIDEQVRKIFREGEAEKTVPETVEINKKKINKNKVWLVAACIAILVALFSIISVANDWNVFDFLSEKFGSVFSTPIEEELDFNGITVTFHGKTSTYPTVENALKTEKIEILYPEILPNDIEIYNITFYQKEKVNRLVYNFNDPTLCAEISFNSTVSQSIINDATEKKVIDSITCYICEMPDISLYQVDFEYKNNHYFFSHSDKDVLIKIIENLKEIHNEN